MAQRPRTREPDELDKRAAALAGYVKDLFSITSQLNKLPREGSVVVNGVSYDRSRIRQLRQRAVSAIKALPRTFRRLGGRAREGGRYSAGFRLPIVLDDNFVEFMRAAFTTDAGDGTPYIDPNVRGTNFNFVRDMVLFRSEDGLPLNVTTAATLTPLLTYYAKHADLKRYSTTNRGATAENIKGNMLGADPLMGEFFFLNNALVDRINTKRRLDFEIQLARGSKKALKKLAENGGYNQFDPNNFAYAGLQSVVAASKIPRDRQNAAQQRWTAPIDPSVRSSYQLTVLETKQRAIGEYNEAVRQGNVNAAMPAVPYESIATGVLNAVAQRTGAAIPTDVQQALLNRARLDAEQQYASAQLADYRARTEQAGIPTRRRTSRGGGRGRGRGARA